MVGWEASGRNGGGCSHHHSPLFAEEQRLWPLMDDLLGYPTEFQPSTGFASRWTNSGQAYRRALENGERQGFRFRRARRPQIRELVPLAGDAHVGGYFYHFGGHANPHRTVQAYAWAIRTWAGG